MNKRDNVYCRGKLIYCIIKTYGDEYIIMSGGSVYYDDSMTNNIRILLKADELIHFTKIEYDKLHEYDFIYTDVGYYRTIINDYKYHDLDWIIEKLFIDGNHDADDNVQILEKKYGLLRQLKLKRILK